MDAKSLARFLGVSKVSDSVGRLATETAQSNIAATLPLEEDEDEDVKDGGSGVCRRAEVELVGGVWCLVVEVRGGASKFS